MSLEDLHRDLVTALKGRDFLRVSVLRLLISEIKNKEISLRAQGRLLDEAAIEEVILHAVKQRRESISAYSKADRNDLVDGETAELGVLQTYLPAPISESELKKIVQESISEVGAASPGDHGRVMSVLMPKIKGRCDGTQISSLVKELLSS